MLYRRLNLADGSAIGEPAEIPAPLGGPNTGLTDAILADLSAGLGEPCATEIGFSGQGFFPMTRKVTLIEFKFRLTAAERIAIRAAAAGGDPIVTDFLDILNATPIVELDNEATIAGLAYLVSLSLLTSERAAEIRA